jgi:rubrerythrin
MNVYKCKICGDPYVGNTKPSNCPFCGAPAKFMILAVNWVDREALQLSELSREKLVQSLEMELDNARFYRCATKAAEDQLALAMFEALSRIEAAHARTVCRLLGRAEEHVGDDSETCSATSPREHLEEALRREREAVRFYRSAAELAVEEQVEEYFRALVEVEEDHISLSNLGLGVA